MAFSSNPQHFPQPWIARAADGHLSARPQDGDVGLFLVRIDLGDLLDLHDVGAMHAHKLLFGQRPLEILHRTAFQERAVVGVDLHEVVAGFQVMDLLHGDDVDF